jgi:tetratricopeptide (TPR) repeat protein
MLATTKENSVDLALRLGNQPSWRVARQGPLRRRARRELYLDPPAVELKRNFITIARALAALLTDAHGVRDYYRAAMACAVLFKWSFAVCEGESRAEARRARGAGARSDPGFIDERTTIDREALYAALDLLTKRLVAHGGDRWMKSADAGRIREKIREASAVGSARRDDDVCEDAAKILIEDDDIDGAIAVLETAERRAIATREQRVWRGGQDRRRMLALCEHLRWARMMRDKSLAKFSMTKDTASVLPLMEKKGNSSRGVNRSADVNPEALRLSMSALRSLDSTLRDDAGDATCAVAQAQIHLFQGNFGKARDVLQRCLHANPDDADINAALAELLVNMRQQAPKKVDATSVVSACAAALRVDPTARAPLNTLWELADNDEISGNVVQKLLLEALASCVEEQPLNCHAWVMLATMLSGWRALDGLLRRSKATGDNVQSTSAKATLPSQPPSPSVSSYSLMTSSSLSSSDESGSESDSSDSDDSEDAEVGVSIVFAKARLYDERPLDSGIVSHVFNEDRAWWANSMFNIEGGKVRLARKRDVFIWRARHVVALILYPNSPATLKLKLFLQPLKVRVPHVKESTYKDAFPVELVSRCAERSSMFLSRAAATRANERVTLKRKTKRVTVSNVHDNDSVDEHELLAQSGRSSTVSTKRAKLEIAAAEMRGKLARARKDMQKYLSRTQKKPKPTKRQGKGLANRLQIFEAAVEQGHGVAQEVVEKLREEKAQLDIARKERLRHYMRSYRQKKASK